MFKCQCKREHAYMNTSTRDRSTAHRPIFNFKFSKIYTKRTNNNCLELAHNKMVTFEGSFEVPSGYGGCLRPSWACLPSLCQAKSQLYFGPTAPRLAFFMGHG